MDRRACATLSLVLLGCAAPSVPPHDGGPVALDFVVSVFQSGLDSSSIPPRAFGYDLDGRVGGDGVAVCTGADDFDDRLDGTHGIDNEFASLLSASDANAAIARNALMVVRIEGADDLVNDDRVEVSLWQAGTLDGHEPVLDASATLALHQSLAVRRPMGRGIGAIHDGRLIFDVDSAWIPVSEDAAYGSAMPIRRVHFESRIDALRLTEGQLGGAVSVDDLLPILSCAGTAHDRAGVEALVRPDLDPMGPDGAHCASVSLGVGLEAVAAQLAVDRFAPAPSCLPAPLPAPIASASCPAPELHPAGAAAPIRAPELPPVPAIWVVSVAADPACAVQQAVAMGATFCSRLDIARAFTVFASSDVIEALATRADVVGVELNTTGCW